MGLFLDDTDKWFLIQGTEFKDFHPSIHDILKAAHLNNQKIDGRVLSTQLKRVVKCV